MEYVNKKRLMYFILLSLLILPSLNALTCTDITNNKRPSIELSYTTEIDGVYLTRYELSDTAKEMIQLTCETPQNCEGPAQTYVLRPINALPNNVYTLNITAEDIVGNERSSSCEFRVTNPFLNISLINPRFGISPTEAFNLSIQTSEPASVCTVYGQDISFFELVKTASSIFEKVSDTVFRQNGYLLSDQDKRDIFIKCNDTEGLNNDMFPAIFEIGVDSTKPAIELYKDPQEVTDLPLRARIGAKSEDRVFCIIRETETVPTLFDFNLNSVAISDFSKDFYKDLDDQTNPAIDGEDDYEFYVTCINRAELMSETKKIDLKVYFPNGAIKATYPNGYISDAEIVLEAETNKKGTCQVKINNKFVDMNTQTQKNHTLPIPKLTDGNYSFDIKCSFISGGLNAVGVISFTLDTIKPSATSINGAAFTCSDSMLTNNFTFAATDNSGIGGYEYKLLEGTKVLREWTKTSSTPEITGLELESAKTYTLYARAIDVAGNLGDYNSKTFALDPSKKECIYEGPPKVRLAKNQTNEGLLITMECISNVGCTVKKYFLIEPESTCKSCEECQNRYVYIDPVKITKNGDNLFCYFAQDSLQNQVNGSEIIKYNNTNKESQKPQTIITPSREDSDNDGIPNFYETQYLSCGLSDKKYEDRYLDSDDDGLYNIEEFQSGTNPCLKDTDADNILDGGERTSQTNPNQTNSTPPDTDKDGMDDNWELQHFGSLAITNNLSDYDNDTLTDLKEYLYNTNPAIKDTDKDNLEDGEEINQHKTWASKSDTDEDAYDDFIEIENKTDPLNPRNYPKTENTAEELPVIEPEPEKINLLAIILLIIGLIMILSGTGYLFYDYYYLDKFKSTNTNNQPQNLQKNIPQTQNSPSNQNPANKNTQTVQTQNNPINKAMAALTNRFGKKNIEQDPNAKKLFELRMQKKHQKRRDLLRELDGTKNQSPSEQISLSFDQFSKTNTKEGKTQKPRPIENRYAQNPNIPQKTLIPQNTKTADNNKNQSKDLFDSLDGLSKNEKTYTDKLDGIIKNQKETKETKTDEIKNQKQQNEDKLQNLIDSKNITSSKKLDEFSKEDKEDPLKKLDELAGKSLNPKRVFENLTDLIKDRESRQTIVQAAQKKDLNKEDIMQTLSQLASQPKLMDLEIFKVVLSKLLETKKISKTDVSSMLFDMEGRGSIDKTQLLLMLKELKIPK